MTNSATRDLGAADVGREVQRLYTNLDRWTDAQILGLGEDWDSESLRLAYHRSVRRYHPDAVANADDALKQMLPAVFMRVVEAYQALRSTGRAKPGRPRAMAGPAGAGATSTTVSDRRSSAAPLSTPTPEAVDDQAAPTRGEGPGLQSPLPEAASPLGSETRGRALPHLVEPAPNELPRPTLEDAPAVVATALAEARRLARAGDPEGVIAVLHKVLARADEPHRREIQLELARAYVSDTRWRRYGLALLRDMTTADADDAQALAILGGVYYREGLLARAKATLSHAVAVRPSLQEASSTLLLVERALEHRSRQSETVLRPESSGFWARLSQSLQRPAASTAIRPRRVASAA